MKSIVVAYDKNYGIGAHNDLLWLRDLPNDQRRFKELTTGGAIIMGTKTYESIGRPLPNRQNIVVSRTPRSIEGVTSVDSLQAAYAAVEPGRETFVIGGGQIYALAMDSVDRIYATQVDAGFEQADIFFPTISDDTWQEVSREVHQKDEKNKYNYTFLVYERRRP